MIGKQYEKRSHQIVYLKNAFILKYKAEIEN